MTAALFTISPFVVGWSKELIVVWFFISLLLIIFVSDMHYKIISDKVLIVFTLLFIILRLWSPLDPWWDMFLGAGIGFAVLYLIALISLLLTGKEGMGGGDIKLFAVLGLVLGWKGVLLTFFLATLLGALIGGLGILFGLLERKKSIAFGPFIGVGAIITFYYSNLLIQYYLSFLF